MKTVKNTNGSRLFNFISKECPSSLKCESIAWGYGELNVIYREGYKRSLIARFLESRGDAIATVFFDEVTLYHPEWYSDFEDLLHKYEKMYKVETTLTYWDSV